jgi:hypothetical protein
MAEHRKAPTIGGYAVLMIALLLMAVGTYGVFTYSGCAPTCNRRSWQRRGRS